MKVFFPFLFLLCLSFSGFSQNEISDSLIDGLCKTLDSNRDLSDSVRFREIIYSHILPIVSKFDESRQEDVFNYITIRLQNVCREFKILSENIFPNKGDWEHRDEEPPASQDPKICNDFFKHKKFYYLEADGDTTYVTLENHFWIDHFPDETYSKLKFYRVNDCEFEIEFMESTNYGRKNISRPGDKYQYKILEKGSGYFKISLKNEELKRYSIFKMYLQNTR